jgi:hypothetical protein
MAVEMAKPVFVWATGIDAVSVCFVCVFVRGYNMERISGVIVTYREGKNSIENENVIFNVSPPQDQQCVDKYGVFFNRRIR